MKYLSDDHADYRCLENYLEQGGLGELPNLGLHKIQHDKRNSDIAFEYMKQKNADLIRHDTENVAETISKKILDTPLPTRFDCPWAHHQISDLLHRLKKSAEELGLEVGNFPLHATVPTGQINAMAVSVPRSSRKFLLFDPELLTFCNLISKLYAQCLTPNEKFGSGNIKILQAIIDGSPEIAGRLKAVLEAFVKTGRPGTSAPFSVDMGSIELSHIFRTGMEFFVVGHEFGHVYAGHLDELILKFHMISPELSVPSSHIEEFEADYFGLVLTIYALRKEGVELRHILGAIKLFFSSLDLAKRYADFKSYGANRKFISEESSTHPSNASRKLAIDKAIEQLGVKDEDLEKNKQFYSLIEETTDRLWQSISSTKLKVRGNDICLCGSGKKYKKCCRH